jgi:hypothetical protein
MSGASKIRSADHLGQLKLSGKQKFDVAIYINGLIRCLSLTNNVNI